VVGALDSTELAQRNNENLTIRKDSTLQTPLTSYCVWRVNLRAVAQSLLKFSVEMPRFYNKLFSIFIFTAFWFSLLLIRYINYDLLKSQHKHLRFVVLSDLGITGTNFILLLNKNNISFILLVPLFALEKGGGYFIYFGEFKSFSNYIIRDGTSFNLKLFKNSRCGL
jgi:hypothetical protein